jgi:hypothetical protein
MQTKLKRWEAAFRMRRAGLSVAVLTAAPILAAALVTCAPNQAYAGCGVSHPSGVHANRGGGGVHVATSTAAASGGGGTASGCSTGASVTAAQGLATAASGRVVETGAHAARTANHVRTAPTRTTNATAHLRAVRPAHHA